LKTLLSTTKFEFFHALMVRTQFSEVGQILPSVLIVLNLLNSELK
jgi:hypothetical protein